MIYFWENNSMKKKILFLIIIISLISTSILVSCSIKDRRFAEKDIKFETIVPIATNTLLFTSSPIVINQESSEINSTLPFYSGYANTIGVTQIPISFSTMEPPDGNDYIYKNVIVKLSFPLDDLAISYLNLDDIQDTSKDNSDIEVLIDNSGNDSAIYFVVANRAKDYSIYEYNLYSQNISDFASFMKTQDSTYKEIQNTYSFCEDHLSEFGNYPGNFFFKNEPYCVITDEQHMAIVKYIPNSIIHENGQLMLSIDITVYKNEVK